MLAIDKHLYRHFKTNKIYEILCHAKHTESLEDLIVYRCCLTNQVWTRPTKMFEGKATNDDGEPVERFYLVGTA